MTIFTVWKIVLLKKVSKFTQINNILLFYEEINFIIFCTWLGFYQLCIRAHSGDYGYEKDLATSHFIIVFVYQQAGSWQLIFDVWRGTIFMPNTALIAANLFPVRGNSGEKTFYLRKRRKPNEQSPSSYIGGRRVVELGYLAQELWCDQCNISLSLRNVEAELIM